MNTSRLLVLSVITVTVLATASAFAAPCDSVESAGASSAYQKVDALLSEQIVVNQLQSAGLSADQARAHLAQLSESQLTTLASQADLIRAGGTIQNDPTGAVGPFHYVFRQIGIIFTNIYRVLFSWKDLK